MPNYPTLIPKTRRGDAESLRRYGTPHSGGQFASREVGLGANREGSENGEDQPRRSLNPRPLGLGLLFFFLRKLEEARVDLIGHFGKHQQVVAPEALRRLPFTSVGFVETREGDVVPRLLFGSVRPDRGLDATDVDFSDGFLVSHNVFPPVKLRVCECFRSPAHGGNGQTLTKEEQRRRSR